MKAIDSFFGLFSLQMLNNESLRLIYFLKFFKLIKNQDTKELLLTMAYVFEVSTSEHGAQSKIFRLTK
jgi:hypothetical protein